jgi:hypothetical protein
LGPRPGDDADLPPVETDVDLSVPEPLVHALLVHDPAAAEALAAAVRAEGYAVTLDTHDGGWTWIVRAEESAPRTAGERARLLSLAGKHGALYEGWADNRP